ncbi:MAG: transporter substrate-binding domain-containing protein [Firmicutes bacterium]|nr:transporter substrate-binding domain-containing protein [Bacillota bacterium]
MKSLQMKKLFALLLVLVLGMSMLAGCGGGTEEESGNGNDEVVGDTSLQAILDKGEITVAISPDYAPYEYLDLTTGEIKGSDIEMAKYIADQLGVELKIDQMSFESCLAAAELGSSDLAISSLSWSPERAEVMELSSYYNMDTSIAQTILVKASEVDQYKTAEDFAGKKIAAQNGTTQWNLTTSQIVDVEATPISLMNDGVMMLMENKVDGLACQTDVAQSFAENYDELAVPEFLFDFEELGNVVATKKGNVALNEKISEIIDQLEADGLYAKWIAEATEDAAAQGLLD